ncbi:MAG: 2-oxo acid dehydrogenase subunit E2, partial [Planctomycetaceae bacterium]
EADVLAAPRTAAPEPAPRAPAHLAALPRRRRVIAERMLAGMRDNAPVTLHCRADVTALVALRARLKAEGAAPPPAYHDLLAKAVAAALSRHPALAGCWDPGGRLVVPGPDGIHIGIAVDTDDGLVVPVVRDVARRALSAVAEESRALVARARAGRLQAADMDGGVFTITNLGGFGIDAFTPIINLPQAAILGLGAIRREPAATRAADSAETVAIHDVMALSLTFDHCRVDGAPAARFLDDVRRGIEAPGGIIGSGPGAAPAPADRGSA